MVDTVSITKDAWVYSVSPTTNYGTDDALWAHTDSSISWYQYTLIDWNLSSITMEDVVDIELKIRGRFTSTHQVDIFAHKITAAWAASTVTYDNQPGHQTASFADFEFDTTVDKWYTVDILEWVAGDHHGDFTDYGIKLIADDTGQTVTWFSYEYTTTSYRPYIEVTYHSDYGYYWSNYTGLSYNGAVIYLTGNAAVYQGETNQTSYETAVNFYTPWGTSLESTEYMDLYDTVTYSRSGSGYTEYFTAYYHSVGYIAGEGIYYPIYFIKWYRDYGKRYVKTDGDDDAGGNNWNNAWKTVNKGMEETPANYELHVGFGTYSSEPANNKLSPDNANVTVIFETATTGGGTGTASIEVN